MREKKKSMSIREFFFKFTFCFHRDTKCQEIAQKYRQEEHLFVTFGLSVPALRRLHRLLWLGHLQADLPALQIHAQQDGRALHPDRVVLLLNRRGCGVLCIMPTSLTFSPGGAASSA